MISCKGCYWYEANPVGGPGVCLRIRTTDRPNFTVEMSRCHKWRCLRCHGKWDTCECEGRDGGRA